MNEADWLACIDPVEMLESLPGEVSDRKLRLFACACCRHFQDWVDDEPFLDAVASAEQFSDGQGTKAALKRARQSVRAVRHRLPTEQGQPNVEWVALWLAEVTASENAFGKVAHEIQRLESEGLLMPEERPSGDAFLRCIFGNPFRNVPVDPRWLTDNVVELAQEIYDERTLVRLPSLAEELKDAECDNRDILSHCRHKGRHVRGCWVVDLALGRS
jgi:hypothetical protein